MPVESHVVALMRAHLPSDSKTLAEYLRGDVEVAVIYGSEGPLKDMCDRRDRLTFSAWDKLAYDLEDEDGYNRIVEVGGALVQRQDMEIGATIRATKRRMVIGGHNVPVCNAPYQMANEMGNILCKGEPFAATYFDAADGTRSFSLRSLKDDPNAANVAVIAESYGGGGHPNASGFRRPVGWEGDVEIVWAN